jgi:8-oxo-dGTP pyrophosphatase MutT (NUDIX family)
MAVTARPSATVVLVRPGPAPDAPWETYLLRRSAQSPVLAEMWVFPGGTIRPDDHDPVLPTITPGLTPEAAHAVFSRGPDVPAPTVQESYAHFVAAGRELVEEAGVVLTNADTSALTRNGETRARFIGQREALERGEPLLKLARELGVQFALEQLVYYAHWITPEALPQRFDTRFFLARLPEGQEAIPSAFEMADGIWISAADALAKSRAGELMLHFATINHLRRLAPYSTLDELFKFATSKSVVPIMPQTLEKDGRIMPFLPPELEGVW